MSRTNLCLMMLVSALLLGFGTPTARATTTYIAGTCKPGTQFSTIQSALNAGTRRTTVVEVCSRLIPAAYTISILVEFSVTGPNGRTVIQVRTRRKMSRARSPPR